jgi:PTH1 family peptidyl-tRNA hydrolase
MRSYLLVGLGNVGAEYAHTRHNIGFEVLDALLEREGAGTSFATRRYAQVAECRVKNVRLVLIKPTTLMNLSGQAVNYWLQQEKIPLSQLLVVVDDVALPLGTLRLKIKGSDGGHNGLKDIQRRLGRSDYARLRFGIGQDYPKGRQIDYVLGRWTRQQEAELPPRIEAAAEACKSFALTGPQRTMNQFNG